MKVIYIPMFLSVTVHYNSLGLQIFFEVASVYNTRYDFTRYFPNFQSLSDKKYPIKIAVAKKQIIFHKSSGPIMCLSFTQINTYVWIWSAYDTTKTTYDISRAIFWCFLWVTNLIISYVLVTKPKPNWHFLTKTAFMYLINL